MDDQHKNFSVWVFRERYWEEGDAGRKLAGTFQEPAEAADYAEQWLNKLGIPGQSYCELRFNGDPKPHTVICFMDENRFGIWNTDNVKWPIFYPAEGAGDMLSEFPFPDAMDGAKWKDDPEADKSEESDEGDMRLDEIEPTHEEDETDEEEDDAAESEEDSGEDEEDDSGDESDDDSDSSSDESDGDSDEDISESDDEDEGEDSDDDDSSGHDEGSDDEEDEIEMPRLKIFAKFRGPLGWRKRAETEELQDKNTFALKIGILNEDEEKTAAQEREVFAHIEFIEFDEDREAGILRIKIPEGVEFSERTKSGWITASIPYRSGDEDA